MVGQLEFWACSTTMWMQKPDAPKQSCIRGGLVVARVGRGGVTAGAAGAARTRNPRFAHLQCMPQRQTIITLSLHSIYTDLHWVYSTFMQVQQNYTV